MGPSYDEAYYFGIRLPPYTIVNARIGLSKDNWTARLFVNDLTNKVAELTANNTSWQFNIPAVVRFSTNQPRTFRHGDQLPFLTTIANYVGEAGNALHSPHVYSIDGQGRFDGNARRRDNSMPQSRRSPWSTVGRKGEFAGDLHPWGCSRPQGGERGSGYSLKRGD